VRTLLVDDQLSLPVALDEILSLAKNAASAYDPSQPAGERIQAIAQGHDSIGHSLGPHRLLREPLTPEATIFPEDLWWDTIALITRLFPGLGQDSVCRDFGDAQPLALESVFADSLSMLENLLIRSKSLLLVDWNYNREIRSVIGKFIHRAATGKSPAASHH